MANEVYGYKDNFEKVEVISKQQAYNVLHGLGDTWFSIDGTTPAGGLPYLGQVVSKTLYEDLWGWVVANNKKITEAEWQSIASSQDGDCNKYADISPTEFRLPKITHYIRAGEANDINKGWIDESLPNIKGSAFLAGVETISGADALYMQGKRSHAYSGHSPGAQYSAELAFGAGRYSKIYQDNAHVQPNTNIVLMGVYAVGIINNLGSVEASQIMASLSNMELAFENRAIVDSGENYIRFGNGTQICWDEVQVDHAGWRARGSGFQSSITPSYSFPKPFVIKPQISITLSYDSPSSSSVSLVKYTEYGIYQINIVDFSNSNNSGKWYFEYIAIGRWK